MAIAVLVIAAAASALRGGKYVHEEAAEAAALATGAATSGAGTDIVNDKIAASMSGNGVSPADAEHSMEAVRTPYGRATPEA